MQEEIKILTLCPDHRKNFLRFDFTERDCDYCALLDRVERLEEINFELEENLKAAQDQNHYFVLCGKWRDKYYSVIRENERLRSLVEGLEEPLEDSARIP